MENIVELDLPLLLPGIVDDQDACIQRLEESLQEQDGILRLHFEREVDPIRLCLHYDPDAITLSQVRRIASRTGTEIINRYHHASLTIEGMDCSDCAHVVEHSLGRMDGVLSVSVNYAAQKTRIEYDSHRTSQAQIEKRIRALGYRVPTEGLQSWFQENRQLLFSLTAGLFLLAGWLVEQFTLFPYIISLGLYIAAYIAGGLDVARHAYQALRIRHMDTDLLMILAALGAAALGEFAEGALLLFLFSLGHTLEDRALDRARSAIRSLADLAPKTAFALRDGQQIELPVDSLKLEDKIIVLPGVRIPADGVIRTGHSAVDQSPVTGESLPVERAPGDNVYAGSVNGEGALEVRVTRLARDSTLSRVIRMVEEAQSLKPPTQQAIERFEHYFVPAVLIVTALVIILPPLFGLPLRQSFLRAMTLLVAASPCALALGTPSAVLAGLAQAARHGILVKGGIHLENLGRIVAIAFDKTGTITHGKPEPTDILPLNSKPGNAPPKDDKEILALAASVESRSTHPLARALVTAAIREGFSLPDISGAKSFSGLGMLASVNGSQVLVGSQKLMHTHNVDVPDEARTHIETLEGEGKTGVLVAVDSELIGLIALADTLRPEAKPVVTDMRRLGIHETVMLTGDNPRAAEAIAGQAGMSAFHAGLLPKDKLDVIRSLVDRFTYVAMVGDGVNDAPALAHATVGIAMGGAGSDVALETADVALMADDLTRLPFAIGLGRATLAVIRQNLVIALVVIALLSVASISGLAGIGLAVLIHEGSTLLVVLNSLRLLGYTPPPPPQSPLSRTYLQQ